MFLALLFSRVALAFPEESAWVPLTHDGAVMVDASDDHLHEAGASDVTDLAGDDALPVAEWYADDSALYLRMRLNDEPDLHGILYSCAWAFRFDTDGDTADWELEVVGTGPFGTVTGYTNSGTGLDDPADTYVIGFEDGDLDVADAGSALNLQEDWWLAFAIPRADLDPYLGDTFRVLAVTETTGSATSMDTDFANFDDTDGASPDVAAWSDLIGIDQDDDGLTDLEEGEAGTDPTDADSDDDGLSDADELEVYGTDPNNADSDGDGVQDGTELGLTSGGADTDPGVFVPDDDPSTVTDPLDSDSDDGGLTDGTEDRDHDGRIDPYETDPNDPSDDVDSDGDGIPDAAEDECDGTDTTDVDGDGIPDADESTGDSDGDGLPDWCDEDDDGDGLATTTEGTEDHDGDGVDDHLDTDSNGNGIPDSEDGTGDDDCDGIPAFQDLDFTDGPCADPDGDGVVNSDEADCGSDPYDADTDDDGIGDGDESCEMDCDQLPDRLDPDDDEGECDSAGDTDSTQDCTVDFTCGSFTGGACSTIPLSAAVVPSVLAAALVLGRRRRGGPGRRRRKAAALAAATLLPGVASAADLDSERFSPALDTTVGFGVDDTEIGDGVGGGLFFDYANDPLVYRYDDASRGEAVALANLTSTNVFVTYGWNFLRVGADMPFHTVDGPLSGTGFALGDLRLDAKVRFLPRRGWSPGVALAADATLPTGTDGSLVAAASPTFGGRALFSVGDDFVLDANVGIEGGTTVQLDSSTLWGTSLLWGVGASYPIWKAHDLRLIAEADGGWSLSGMGARGAAPVEWRAGADVRLWRSLHARAAAGSGLTEGIGAPDLRILAGVTWTPEPRHRNDRDNDGILDADDQCPDDAEDHNGVEDTDGCPDAGRVRTRFAVVDLSSRPIAQSTYELLDGDDQGSWQLPAGEMFRRVAPGAYRVRGKAEGYTPVETTCTVNERELADCAVQVSRIDDKGNIHLHVHDQAGAPIDAQLQIGEEVESDTGPDGDDTVTVGSGERTVWIYGDAYRAVRRKVVVKKGETAELDVTLEPSKTKVEADRIEIYEMVLFDTDKATIRPESYGILDDVYGKLQRHPEIHQVLIEGYTDSMGAKKHNQDLSEARAAAVRTYLIEAGIAPSRLLARGFGETAAVAARGDEVDDPAQRRVVFRILGK